MADAGLDSLNPDLFLTRSASGLADRDLLIIGGWDDNGVTLERYKIHSIVPLKTIMPVTLKSKPFRTIAHSAKQGSDWLR